MCRPEYYGINYKINPWMDVKNQANFSLAKNQWESLKNTLELLDVEIILIDPEPEVPDMVFTANAGMIKNKDFYLSKFKHSERQKEEIYFAKFFEKLECKVIKAEQQFEGAGDCLFFKEQLICGYGFRTYQSSYYDIPFDKIFLELVDSRFYHLDTCFCPLQNEDFLFYPHAFSPEANETLEYLGNGIKIDHTEAHRFACNAICVENNVVLPTGCPNTENKLNELGYKTYSVDMSEFMKSGGACKCLTLKLN